MSKGHGYLRLAFVVVGVAASLVLSLYYPVVAGQSKAFPTMECFSCHGAYGPERGAASTDVVADISAKCAKCHSPCEYGTSHAGLTPTEGAFSGQLPLDGGGRTNCLTCHDSHLHGVRGAGSHLRMSNLRRELCLSCHLQETEGLPRITIISPPQGAVTQEDRIALIGKASRLSGSLLAVRLNGSEFHLHVKGGELFTWLKLRDGSNQIEIAQGERTLWKGEVLYGADALGSFGSTSSGHRTENREQCLGCHQKRDNLGGETTAAAPGLCYGCHKSFDQKRYIHGPLAVGDCLACHDPHSGYGSAHLRQEQVKLCGNCHAGREQSAQTACRPSLKGCVECHDPHQSDTRYLLKGPQYTMRTTVPENR